MLNGVTACTGTLVWFAIHKVNYRLRIDPNWNELIATHLISRPFHFPPKRLGRIIQHNKREHHQSERAGHTPATAWWIPSTNLLVFRNGSLRIVLDLALNFAPINLTAFRQLFSASLPGNAILNKTQFRHDATASSSCNSAVTGIVSWQTAPRPTVPAF